MEIEEMLKIKGIEIIQQAEKDLTLYSFDICSSCLKNGVSLNRTLSVSDNYVPMQIAGKFWIPGCGRWSYKNGEEKNWGLSPACPYVLEHTIGKKKLVLTCPQDLDGLKKDILDGRAIMLRSNKNWVIWFIRDKVAFAKEHGDLKMLFRAKAFGFIDDDVAEKFQSEFYYHYTKEQLEQSIIMISMERFNQLINQIKARSSFAYAKKLAGGAKSKRSSK